MLLLWSVMLCRQALISCLRGGCILQSILCSWRKSALLINYSGVSRGLWSACYYLSSVGRSTAKYVGLCCLCVSNFRHLFCSPSQVSWCSLLLWQQMYKQKEMLLWSKRTAGISRLCGLYLLHPGAEAGLVVQVSQCVPPLGEWPHLRVQEALPSSAVCGSFAWALHSERTPLPALQELQAKEIARLIIQVHYSSR